MTERTCFARSVGLAVLLFSSLAPAFAAPPPPPAGQAPRSLGELDKTSMQEASCVYDALSDAQVVMMVDTYLNDDQAKKPEVEKMLAAPQKTCGDKYQWSAQKHQLASEIALQSGVIDILLQDMVDNGLKDDGVVVKVWQTLPDDQLAPLFKDGWSSDQALVDRLKKALVDAGVPDKADVLDNGAIVLAAATRESGAMDRWSRLGKK